MAGRPGRKEAVATSREKEDHQEKTRNMTKPSDLDPLKTYRAWHLLEHRGMNLGHCITDVSVEDDIIYAVFEWMETHDGDVPTIRLPLDPQWLDAFQDEKADFLYQFPVVLPDEVPLEMLRLALG